jgi:hypothetical protein
VIPPNAICLARTHRKCNLIHLQLATFIIPTSEGGLVGLNEIIGATCAIEGSAYWIALVVSWMQTLGSQPVMPKISPITGTRGLPKP